MQKIIERFNWWLAHVMPRQLAYFAYIRVMAHATTGPWGMEHPDDVGYSKAAKRWEMKR